MADQKAKAHQPAFGGPDDAGSGEQRPWQRAGAMAVATSSRTQARAGQQNGDQMALPSPGSRKRDRKAAQKQLIDAQSVASGRSRFTAYNDEKRYADKSEA